MMLTLDLHSKSTLKQTNKQKKTNKNTGNTKTATIVANIKVLELDLSLSKCVREFPCLYDKTIMGRSGAF